MFIRVDMTPEVVGDAGLVKKLVEVCPVNIFEQATDGSAAIVEENLDPGEEPIDLKAKDPESGRESYHPNVVLDLDYTVLIPKRR